MVGRDHSARYHGTASALQLLVAGCLLFVLLQMHGDASLDYERGGRGYPQLWVISAYINIGINMKRKMLQGFEYGTSCGETIHPE